MTTADTARTVLRGLAAFEAIKGLLAVAAGLELVVLGHHDLRPLATTRVGHAGLRPGHPDLARALGELDRVSSAGHATLFLAVSGYTAWRSAEAFGLWHARPWAERWCAGSGTLYLPFELQHLLHRHDALGAAVLAANLAMLGFVMWRLHARRAASADVTAVTRRLRACNEA